MDTELDPVVGNWYRRVDKDLLFKVVAFDEDREVVEIQRFDGELDEIDASVWFDLEIEPADEPEDWDDPLDDLEEDDTRPTRAVAEDWEEDLEDDETDVDEDDWDDDETDDDDEDDDQDDDDDETDDDDEDDDDWDGDEDDDETDDSDDDR